MLEDTTPLNLQNLKSFNSHQHTPYPPSDLKTVVDMAEQQGKWANLVFHSPCNDDGAIDYAATKDVWVAPIGTVVKYTVQAERFVLVDYQVTSDKLTFSFNRLPIPPSSVRSFETAIKPTDQITLQIDINDLLPVQSVRLNGADYPYTIKTVNGNRVLLIDTVIDTVVRSVEIS